MAFEELIINHNMCSTRAMLHYVYLSDNVSFPQDFHRKLEIEKSERRNSDSKALQLLSEVREQGRIAQKLRENEDK